MDTTLEANVLSRAVRMHLREGRAQRAKQLVGAWRERAPLAAAPVALESVLELAGGSLDKAQELSRQAIAIDRNCPHALAVAAQVHAAGGRHDEALLCARSALQLDPASADAAQLLAQLHLQAGRLAEAMDVLREATAVDHPEATAQLMLAELLLRSGEAVDEGEQLCWQLCEAHPHMASAWALHALALAMQGDAEVARQEFGLALALEPDHPVYLLELARLLLNGARPPSADLAEAEALARKAQALHPQEWRAAIVLADALKRQRQFLPAMKVLSEAAKAQPQQAELWMALASTCGPVGQLQAAAQALEKAQALKVSMAVLGSLRFDLELRRGELARALSSFESADAVRRAGQSRLQPLGQAPATADGLVVGFVAEGASHCLMFVRYMALLAEAGIVARLWAPDALAPLLSRVPGVTGVVNHLSQLNASSVEPLTRAPILLGLEESSPPTPVYLSADATTVEGVKMRRAAVSGPVVLLDLGEEPDPGLLVQMGQWLQQHGVNLVLLRPPPPAWKGLVMRFQVLPEDDFEQLAAWVAVADAIVAADVPLSHLAGGMGAKAHTVLPSVHDAVWGIEGPSSTWYPSLCLYRESLQAGWGEAWPRLQDALNAQLALTPAPQA